MVCCEMSSKSAVVVVGPFFIASNLWVMFSTPDLGKIVAFYSEEAAEKQQTQQQQQRQGHWNLSSPDLAIEVAIVITKTLISPSGVFRRRSWLSTNWHSDMYQLLSMSEWNLLGRSDSDRKTHLRSRSTGDQTSKNSSFWRISCDGSACDWL